MSSPTKTSKGEKQKNKPADPSLVGVLELVSSICPIRISSPMVIIDAETVFKRLEFRDFRINNFVVDCSFK